MGRVLQLARIALGRLRYLDPHHVRFRGVYGSHQEALAAVGKHKLAGYNHERVAPVSFDAMCELTLWDYPILYWLTSLGPQTRRLLDAGGHMGTKYRAFREHLKLEQPIEWWVYDLPAIVSAGRERAQREQLSGLRFIDSLAEAPEVDVMLASGLLQFLDIPLSALIAGLPRPPRHLLLNKVATRDGRSIVTLENFGFAEVPYHIRNLTEFKMSLDTLGYDVIDQWEIPSLSHVIPTHPELGASTSRGFYARLRS